MDDRKIENLLRAIRTENSLIYRNDTGNGSAGPSRIPLGPLDMSDGDFESFICELNAGDVVAHDCIVDEDTTAKQLIEEAIRAHDDTAIVGPDDLIIQITDDNGWVGYFWVWEYL